MVQLTSTGGEPVSDTVPKIGILVVAYNAATTLAGVLDRIPKGFRHKISEVLVCDDASRDATYLVGLGYKQLAADLPITVVRHPENLGYGGNQKAGYRLAIEHGLDIVVLLHGDGQYAPECLPRLVAPLERGECDAVFGSRMMEPGAALKGGMPRYKYLGNRILTKVENTALGTDLTEFHSGYRAYSVEALKAIPFEKNTDDFNFDTQIIIQLHDAGRRIAEVPIPTYYGSEICYVNGMKYAKNVVADVVRYRLNKAGIGSPEVVTAAAEYQLKASDDSSHGRIVARLAAEPPCSILDLGCSAGHLGEQLRSLGHRVTGVDTTEHPGVRDRVDRFLLADLDDGIPDEVGGDFDVVLCADVIEHTSRPEEILQDAGSRLRAGGVLLASIPNFGHWYPRARVVTGAFDYDQRGILDNTHLRFFTRRSFMRLARRAGFEVRRVEPVGVPLEVLSSRKGPLLRAWNTMEAVMLAVWPKLFAYQFIFELHRQGAPPGAVNDDSGGDPERQLLHMRAG